MGKRKSAKSSGLNFRSYLTITNNSASSTNNVAGGVIIYFGSTVNVKNTIIAGNTQSVNPDVRGAFTSQGYDLIGNTTGSSGFSAANNDILNPAGGAMLGALADNGGKTDTHALLSDSPAIDRGAAANDPATGLSITTDQRGSTRPSDNPSIPNAPGNGSDIGAFEVQAPTAASVSVAGRVRTPNGKGLTNAYITLTDSSGNYRLTRTSAFGYFRFEDVAPGETYIIQVISKRCRFMPQVLTITQDIADLELTMETFSAEGVSRNEAGKPKKAV